ncbi:MAG: hypothetical protein JF606_00075, partial [Burkholderiales bacterium]|nr:hypothetical protein [Burkholderiales bacterium]
MVTATAESVAARQTLPRRASETAPSQQASTSVAAAAHAQKPKKTLRQRTKGLLRRGHRSEPTELAEPNYFDVHSALPHSTPLSELLRQAALEEKLESQEENERRKLLALVPYQGSAGSVNGGASTSGTSHDAPQVPPEQPTSEPMTSKLMDGTAEQQHRDAFASVPDYTEYSLPTTPRPTVASFSEIVVDPQVMESLRRGPLAPGNDTLAIVPVNLTDPDQ